MIQRSPYPVHRFPNSLGEVCFWEYRNSITAMELVAVLFLTTASAMCAAAFDVQRPNGKPSSMAMNSCTLALTGHFKTTAFERAIRPIKAFEKIMKVQYQQDLIEFEASLEMHKIEKKSLERAILRARDRGDSITELKEQHRQLLADKPTRPTEPGFFYNEPTPEFMIEALSKNPCALVASPEGQSFFGQTTTRGMPIWCGTWDGNSISVERKTSGVISCDAPRVAVYVAIQPHEFATFYKRMGRTASSIGFLPRFLFAEVDENAPVRYFTDAPFMEAALDRFTNRGIELLTIGSRLRKSSANRPVMTLSPAAAVLFLHKVNEYRSYTGTGGIFSDIAGFVHKAAEQALRISAVFHVFEGFEGDISVDTLDAAFEVIEWHIWEYKRLFGLSSAAPAPIPDWQLLEEYLLSEWEKGASALPMTQLLQKGPNRLRKAAARNAALNPLIANNRVRLEKDVAGVLYVVLNPDYFASCNIFGQI